MVHQEEFAKATTGLLFTSSSSERGMDYPDVTLVLQLMAPNGRQQYIHRVGRTARNGKEKVGGCRSEMKLRGQS